MRKLIVIACSVLLLLIVLPIITLFASTNIGALSSSLVSLFTSPKLSSDEYDYGECTYWAALRRIQIGLPIPNNWGNAIDWAKNAIKAGYLVNHTPSFGAIMQNPDAYGGLGHVAFVEQVNQSNGSWTISEMNRVGWDEIDQRTFSASSALKYNFIH